MGQLQKTEPNHCSALIAQQPPSEFKKLKAEQTEMLKEMDAEMAEQMLAAAIQKSQEIDAKMNIAIVDAGANLKAFHRMDGAWLGSIDIACKKARTARQFDMPTGEIGSLSQPGGALFNIEHSNGGLISFPGGMPIINKHGEVIGAVGVSGSTVEDDHLVALAAVEAASAVCA